MNRILCLIFATGVVVLTAAAQAQSQAQSLFWDMKVAGVNACARQSVQPATSLFIFADGVTLGRAIAKLSQNNKSDPSFDVKEAWTEMHRSLNFTFNFVLHGLSSGALPLVQTATEADRIQFSFKNQNLSSDKIRCVQVKKSLPLHLKTFNVDKKDLEDLALAYLDAENYVDNCESVNKKNSTKPELVLRFDISRIQKNISFEFWQSFKIYSANFWKRGLFLQKAPRFGKWIQSFPLEELTLLVPEGCGALSRPECRSNFLSQSQITNLVQTKEFETSPLLVKEISRNHVERTQGQLNSPQQSNNGLQSLNPQSFLQDVTKMRHQSALQLFDSQMNLTAIFHQRTPEQLVAEIERSLVNANQETLDELESACVENALVSNADLSGLAKEIHSNQKLISALDKIKFPGQLASISLQKSFKLSSLLAPVCARNKENFLNGTGSAGSRPWVRKYYSSLISQDMVNSLLSASETPAGAYLSQAGETLCSTAIDCWRNVLESTVKLYQVGVQSSVVLNKDKILDSDLGRSLGGAVACRLFDPWAETHKRYQKLLLDTVSAVVSGATLMPIYLNLTPTLPKVASFSQLMEDDAVRLDPIYWNQSWKKTLMIDLGQIANAPCVISISNEADVKLPGTLMLFKGITVNMCSKSNYTELRQDSANLTSAQNNQSHVCGQCSLNFEAVAGVVIQNHFSTFRAGIRLLKGFIDFFRASENPFMSPIENLVRPEHVAKTYEKYNSIPDHCVYELTNGAPCMQNLCVSRTASDFERMYDHKVVEALMTEDDNGKNKAVWLKIEGCADEVKVPVVCENNKLPTFSGLTNAYIPKSCRGKK